MEVLWKMKKQDDSEEKKPQEEENKSDDKIAALSKRMDSFETKMNESVDKILKTLETQKQKEEEYPEGKKPMDEEKKKQEEEDKKPVDEEKKKQEAEPKPGQGQVKLPKAPAGETDETDTPEGDKVSVMEKELKKTLTKMGGEIADEILKAHGITKSKTPRPEHEVTKRAEEPPKEMAMEFINKAKTGDIDPAKINMQIKKRAIHDREAAFRKMFPAIPGGV